MLASIYHQAIRFVPLGSPFLILSMSTPFVFFSQYIYYIIYFFFFFVLLTLTKKRSDSTQNRSNRLLILQGLIAVPLSLAMGAVYFLSTSSLPFTLLVLSTFLLSLPRAPILADRPSLRFLATFLANGSLSLCAFESLGFSNYAATVPYCLAIACLVTGHTLALDATRSIAKEESTPQATTRNQQRKLREKQDTFDDSRPQRVLIVSFFLMAPTILIAQAMTPWLPDNFRVLFILYFFLKPIISALLPSEPTVGLPSNFSRNSTGFAYLFLVMLPLLKIIST